MTQSTRFSSKQQAVCGVALGTERSCGRCGRGVGEGRRQVSFARALKAREFGVLFCGHQEAEAFDLKE